MNQAIDINLVPTAELIAELCKRHDGMIIAGIKFTTQVNFSMTKYWTGNHFICLGILEDMKHQINRNGERSFTTDK